ncbi:Centrosomal protein [Merluccius polli]|uniref:Centrosomal protein of 104 kDa n=1 Tax=Merluccius polli TaxID=89951 RepID=A0AA47M390_MERPO|nr:Centrosomal protein [Merluccius polli]
MALLRPPQVGERLGRYDAEKRSATEKEDYDLAQRRKEQMGRVPEDGVHNLLDLADVAPALTMSTAPSPSQESPSQLPSPGGQEEDRPGAQHQPPARPVGPPAAQPASSKPRRLTESLKKVKKAPLRRGGSERVATGARSASLASTDRSEGAGSQPQPDVPRIDVSSVPYDDRPLPVLRRTDGPGEVVSPRLAGEYAPPPGSSRSPGSSHTSPGLPGWTAEAGPLSDKAQREASLSVEVFGEGLVAGAYSKNWALRERALADVCEKLQGVAPGTSREERRTLVRAAVFLVKRALQDKLSPVFQAALRLLRLLLSQVIPSSGLGRAELSHCLEQTWPSLLARSWDPGRRVRATAAAYILDMAQWKEVRALQVVPSELSRPFKPSSPTRLALGRAELLETLLAELGTDHSGFTLENVMKFCGVALQHSAAEVREVAVRVVLSLYRTHSTAVLQHLPAGDAAARRSVLYKRLFDAFARMDGRVAGSQQKGDAGREDGEKEKEEIRSLQEQLAALKEMSVGGAMTSHLITAVCSGLAPATTGATKVFQNELSADEPPSGVGDLDNLCIFCGKSDESFTEDKLDLHYWKHCPMLRRCEECRQVVEIAGLTDHLLGECESRTRFSQCPRCSEALPAQELSRHAQGPACNPPAPGEDSHHCPLCHSNFLSGEEAWKAHLMGGQGCKQNSRRTVGSQRTQPAQGKAMGGARLRQAWSDGARSKAVNRTSRIPALAPRTTRPQAGRTRPGKRWPPS